jgi:hypothetical protein
MSRDMSLVMKTPSPRHRPEKLKLADPILATVYDLLIEHR